MKILIDMTFVAPNNLHLSLPRVAMRYLSGVPDSNKHNYCLLFEKSAKNGMELLLPEFDYLVIDLLRERNYRFDLRYFLLPFKYRAVVNKSGCDILYIPTEGWFATILKTKIPKVLSINDIKQFKTDFGNYDVTKGFANRISAFMKKVFYLKNIHNADRIITISEYTRKDVLQYFPQVKPENIFTIHCTVSPIMESKKPKGLKENVPYVLNINTIHQFKNPLTLVKAFEIICSEIDIYLILVGRKTDYWKEIIYPYIEEHGLEERVQRLENLEDSELRYLYENTKLFVTPSLHEGFGFTPVEAAIYGAPVISSRSESLPEATMGLVSYYDPATDENILAAKMRDLLINPPKPEELLNISNTFKEEYSPKHQVEKTEIAFQQIINIYESID